MSKKAELAEVVVNKAVEGMCVMVDGIDCVNNLKSKKLARAIKGYVTECGKVEKSQWSATRQLAIMAQDENFADDFASRKELAEFVGISPSALSLSLKLESNYNTVALEDMGFTVSNAFELTKLSADEGERFLELTPYASTMTQKELRAAVKDFKQARLDVDYPDEDVEESTEGESLASTSTYSDEEPEELTVDYTLPIWINKDGGYVCDVKIVLTESQSETISKQLAVILKDLGITF